MDAILARIRRLLHEGREWEARELFFDEVAGWSQMFRSAVNSLLKDPTPEASMEEVWEQFRERLRK